MHVMLRSCGLVPLLYLLSVECVTSQPPVGAIHAECEISVVDIDPGEGLPHLQKTVCLGRGMILELEIPADLVAAVDPAPGDVVSVQGARPNAFAPVAVTGLSIVAHGPMSDGGGRRARKGGGGGDGDGPGRGRGNVLGGEEFLPSRRKHRRLSAGSRTAVAVVVRYVDGEGNVIPPVYTQAETAARIDQALFDVGDAAQPSAKDSFAGCSYGGVHLEADADGRSSPGRSSPSDVFYVDVPLACTPSDPICSGHLGFGYNLAEYCDVYEIYGPMHYAVEKLRRTVAGFDPALWQHKVSVFAAPVQKCGFYGLGTVGCTSGGCLSWLPETSADVPVNYFHEMSHNLGLGHAGVLGAASGGQMGGDEYADLSAAMGYAPYYRCHNAGHGVTLGWASVKQTLERENLVMPVETKAYSTSVRPDGIVHVVHDFGTGHGHEFFVQFKTKEGHDTGLPDAWANSVQIKVKGPKFSTWDAGVKLVAGQSWRPRYSNGVPVGESQTGTPQDATLEIKVLSVNLAPPNGEAPYAVVRVSRTLLPCEDAVCDDPPGHCMGPGTCQIINGTGVCVPEPLTGGVCYDTLEAPCREGTCQAGACIETGDRECPPADDALCLLASTCDAATNVCSDRLPKPDCCGNGACDGDEDCHSCPGDCLSAVMPGAICGNGVCEAGDGESCRTCPRDCPGLTRGKQGERFCCGDTDPCDADGTCHGKACAAEAVAGAQVCCGDGTCAPGVEDPGNCARDCA